MIRIVSQSKVRYGGQISGALPTKFERYRAVETGGTENGERHARVGCTSLESLLFKWNLYVAFFASLGLALHSPNKLHLIREHGR